MQSVKRIVPALVLAIGFLTATARTQTAEKNALAVDGEKHVITAAIAKAQTINAGNLPGAVTPADLSSSQATYFNAAEVTATFAKGGTLVDWANGEWKYRAGIHRQEKPGMPEMHTQMTHIFYVLDGSATYISGGTIIDPKATAPNTIHGTAIDGGETHHLSKGDVIIVPKGVPHWYKEVQSPLILFDVNVH